MQNAPATASAGALLPQVLPDWHCARKGFQNCPHPLGVLYGKCVDFVWIFRGVTTNEHAAPGWSSVERRGSRGQKLSHPPRFLSQFCHNFVTIFGATTHKRPGNRNDGKAARARKRVLRAGEAFRQLS